MTNNALNRYYSPIKFKSRSEFITKGIKCIFISYQSKDKNGAKKIADYLLTAGVNVYFDEYDSDLKVSNQTNNPTKVTNALTKGINNSSHMLVLVSPNTLQSKWVPFEIGYGYDKTDLSVLTLKGIPEGRLPEYMRTAKIIRDIWDINQLVAKLLRVEKETLITAGTIKGYNNQKNTLFNTLDSIILDRY